MSLLIFWGMIIQIVLQAFCIWVTIIGLFAREGYRRQFWKYLFAAFVLVFIRRVLSLVDWSGNNELFLLLDKLILPLSTSILWLIGLWVAVKNTFKISSTVCDLKTSLEELKRKYEQLTQK